jgi:hypothetical protein
VTVIVNSTGFSVQYWARFSEQEFVDHAIQQRIYKELPENTRRQLLLQVYKIIHPDTP